METVLGPIPVDELGTTLMHEHVFVITEELRENFPARWDEEVRVADAIEKLNALADLGVDSIVDPTVIGLGRYLPRLQRVADHVRLNIVVATGVYTYSELPWPFQFEGPNTILGGDEPMTELFVRDVTEGIADTGVKAAFLKCAIEQPGLTPGVERVLRAVGQAHARTGAPVMVHTSAHTDSGEVAHRVLAEEGVDMSKVVLAHSGDTADIDHLLRLLETGCFLGMDRFGLDAFLSTEERVNTVAELCRRGHAGQLVLAHDASCHIDWFPPGAKELAMPNWHYRHIHDDVLPALRERGVTEEQITTMLVDNPRRYFSK